MDDDLAWQDNSGGRLLQYDFAPPAGWSAARIAAAHAAFAEALADRAATVGTPAPGWLALARSLPAPLRAALLAELRAGNRLTAIGSTGWPSDGSIVVNLRERFMAARRGVPDGVRFRILDDPHYAREELSHKAGAVEFLILA